MAKRFIGLWKLIPQACKYDLGQPPLKATYQFSLLPQENNKQDPKHIGVKLVWTDNKNEEFQADYNIRLVGKKQIEQHFGRRIQVYHELTQEGILKSTSYLEDGETVILQAFRELKQNDKILDVLMVKPNPQGNQNTYQKYQKVS